MIMKRPLFPIWQPDRREYDEICAYLEITPREHIYRKLTGYLANAPFRFPRPDGFSLYLAKPALTRFRIARLDLASKLFFPNHPVRHILNGVIALHECDGEGYTELSAAPVGRAVPFALLGWGIRFIVSFVITSGWLGWNLVTYFAGKPLRPREGLTGKRILISGASRGLGLELMLQSLQQGAEVIATVRNPASKDELKSRLPETAPVQLFIADLSVPEALSHALEAGEIAADSVDIAIACAGIKHADASIMDLPQLRDTFEVNYFSSIDLANWLCGPGPESTLVLISSIGRWHGMHSSCGYNASKAALSIWGESLEMELQLAGNRDCNVMIVEPGIFESGMMKKKSVSKFLFASRSDLAARILSGAVTGRKVLRYPFWFALLTWTVCLGGRRLRNRLFARGKV
jgi:NAD(P)-dependent dehydrogenase (short-subunit alcohol dehydrogenase family)